jgi:hypothetical protein
MKMLLFDEVGWLVGGLSDDSGSCGWMKIERLKVGGRQVFVGRWRWQWVDLAGTQSH